MTAALVQREVSECSPARTLVLVIVLVSCVCGCHRGPAVAQIKGKVHYKNGGVPQGGIRVVRFEPKSNTTAEIRKGASGDIQDDGSFELYTRRPGDGVYFGEYAVTFAVWPSAVDSTSLIQPKYTNSATTPYEIKVEGDRDDLTYEIEPK
jgi:hypothetical protein